ncbi:MAG: hypothetical protein QXJ11_02840 [Candidatus Bathyarchaeia archaeon]
MKNCTRQKTDDKGYTNCTKGDSHIGLCQTPCPYGYKAASSASKRECNTSADKPVSSCFRRKRPVESSVAASKNVLHFAIEAVEVE